MTANEKNGKPTPGQPSATRGTGVHFARALLLIALIGVLMLFSLDKANPGDDGLLEAAVAQPLSWFEVLPPSYIFVITCLMVLSAFFSASETAFLSIPRQKMRVMREEGKVLSQLVVQMLDDPGRLLTLILVGNLIVNTAIGVVLGTRMERLFASVLGFTPAGAYIAAIVVVTAIMVFFGDILPKIFAVRAREAYAQIAVIPLMAIGKILAPIQNALLHITDLLFRVTRFHELRAAPYITDEEIKSLVTDTKSEDEIEEDGREMIRRILEFHDVQVRDILVPRPDVVAISEDATVGEAFALYRKCEYSRVPVYRDDLDHITGVLFAKDALPSIVRGDFDRPVKTLSRTPHFVPEVMSVQSFIKNVQRLRSHLAIVVDEFGGTEGIVTLHDAIQQVVGDIKDDDEEEAPLYEQMGEGAYRVRGNMPLDEFSELIDVEFEEQEHQTLGGFIMEHLGKIPAVGDTVEVAGVVFTIDVVTGKRAASISVKLLPKEDEA